LSFFWNCQVSQNLTKQEEDDEGTYNFVCGREKTDDGGFFLSFFLSFRWQFSQKEEEEEEEEEVITVDVSDKEPV
jgi:hypothetical protein